MRQLTYKQVFGVSAKRGLQLVTLLTLPLCRNGFHTRCIECFQTPVRRKFVICSCQCHNVIKGRGYVAPSRSEWAVEEAAQKIAI